MRRLQNVGLVLGQRRRRWANIDTTLHISFRVFLGLLHSSDVSCNVSSKSVENHTFSVFTFLPANALSKYYQITVVIVDQRHRHCIHWFNHRCFNDSFTWPKLGYV